MGKGRSMKAANSKRRHLKPLPLAVAMATCLWGTNALAGNQGQVQEDPDTATAAQLDETQVEAEQDQPQQRATELDRITVTGSLLRRTEYESTSPIQVITADTNVALGQVDAAEFLQQSSVAAGSTQISNQFAGFVVEGGTGVQTLSLRGLGANRTLVLLDGQRPGPAGTRGQVGAFDLNVLPTAAIQRIEIVKDGSSSIYGSDAVAGVVNVITRKRVDRPEINFTARVPSGSGETFSLSGLTGWNFDQGNIMLSGEWYVEEPLLLGDRDFFRCAEDYVFDGPGGNRIDREDRSILAGGPLAGCSGTNLYANTVIDAVTGVRYIPSVDGSTIGDIPGYRPRPTPTPTYANSDQAYFEDVLNFDFYGDTQIVDRQERINLFGQSDFALGPVNWKTQWLYNHRKTDTHRYRQFFPLTGGATAGGHLNPADFDSEEAYLGTLAAWRAAYGYPDSPDFVTPVQSGVAQPIMPFPSKQSVSIDYYYVSTKLDGLLGFTDTWAWEANASYSRSDGDYSVLSIVGSRSGDLDYDTSAPRVNYFDPRFLSGAAMDELVDAVGEWHTGNTIYEQSVVSGLVTGELFNLPAGPLGAAFGLEYRHYSMDDQPSTLEASGDLWGQSSAQVTKGSDNVIEALMELEAPLIVGKPGFESLTVNGSARWFDYDSVDGSDSVWKLGLNWQVVPTMKIRATRGTSFRAPGLYELYLGNLTGFASQISVDPCILWGESNNDFLRTNCAAAGIPADYNGAPSSALVVSGGGAGVLVPETSRATTVGLVLTPTWSNLSVALDYFDYEIRDQIGQLNNSSILGGCYGSPIYPNAFCDLFDRNPGSHPTDPFKIEEIRNTYLNIDRQKTRGYDLILNYDRDFAFGALSLESQITYTKEDIVQLFSTAEESGFESSDRVGDIGRPKLVGDFTARLDRGDWSYMWRVDYVHATKNQDIDERFTYQGWENAWRDIYADRRFYHTASVRYERPDWSVLVGVRNLFDKDPPLISNGVGTRYGNVPAFATQYDWYGRSPYVRLQYKF